MLQHFFELDYMRVRLNKFVQSSMQHQDKHYFEIGTIQKLYLKYYSNLLMKVNCLYLVPIVFLIYYRIQKG